MKPVYVNDSEGVKWSIKFDFGRAALIVSTTGFDFFDQGEKGVRPSTMERIQSAEIDAAKFAWLLCSAQAKRLKIDESEFYDRFDTAEIYNEATNAFNAFFLSLKDKNEAREAAQQSGGVGTTSTKLPLKRDVPTFADEHSENLSQGPKL
jgi:hypothetical protein